MMEEFLTRCVFPQGGSHYYMSEKEHIEGSTNLIHTHTHTPLHKQAGAVIELRTPEVPVGTFFHFIKPCESHFVWSCYGYSLDPAGPRGNEGVLNVCANMLTI